MAVDIALEVAVVVDIALEVAAVVDIALEVAAVVDIALEVAVVATVTTTAGGDTDAADGDPTDGAAQDASERASSAEVAPRRYRFPPHFQRAHRMECRALGAVMPVTILRPRVRSPAIVMFQPAGRPLPPGPSPAVLKFC
ncbi:hypothetical protein ABIB25_004714 [Nakamurella sp. UYEF19]|uniref:hypothetical protein n=1 Tax=Nakamurella sp. UYEF19 TaxID=1756392 RepID=UPI003392D5AC